MAGRLDQLQRRVRNARWQDEPGARTTADQIRLLVVVFVCWRVSHGIVTAAFASGPFASTTFWDAQFYLSIARDGYQLTDPTYESFQNVNFWPALPFLARPFMAVLGDEWGPILLANLLAATAFLSVWGAAKTLFDQRTADHAVLFLACWPGSMFLWAFLSEGLFVTATAGAIWADARGRHGAAAALIFVAGMTRSVGVVFGPVLVLLRIWRLWRLDRVAIGYAGVWLLSFATVLVVMQVSVGDALAPFKSQAAWGRSLGPPWIPVVDAISIIVDKLPSPALETSMNLVVTVLFLVIGTAGLAVALRNRATTRSHPPLSPTAGVWTLVATALPQFTGQITSMLRYVLGAWPGFVLVAYATRTQPRLRLVLLVGQVVVSLWLLRRHAMGIWVA